MIWIIFIGLMIISFIISKSLQVKFQEYSKLSTEGSLSGKEVAEKMLKDFDIYDVQVVCTQGTLSDHYNPTNKTVNLSKAVFEGRNVAAAAVAAHECGHAVQHARAYTWLQMRSKMVPVVQFTSKWVSWVLLAGILLVETFPQLLLAGIIMFGLSTLFSFITLPVEIDASSRALAWLNRNEITSRETHPKAQKALRLAAYTYVVAALSSLATLLYYVMIFMGRRD